MCNAITKNSKSGRTLPAFLFVAACAWGFGPFGANAELKHRWSFNEASGTVFEDSIGGADATLDRIGTQGISGQFVGGMLLGAVWSPCIGPTLGGAISLASQGENLVWAGLIMVAFALGVSTIVLTLAYGAQSVLRRRKEAMMRISQASRPVLGIVFIAVGFAILFKLHHAAEIWVLDNLPPWFTELSVSI